MKVEITAIPDVLLITPRVFGDERGFFYESYNHQAFVEKIGLDFNFVQDNHSRSQKNVLRGLHYQIGKPQGKLVRALAGTIQDVAVDLRQSSPTFGKSVSYILSAENCQQLWIPIGFAHGFAVLSDIAEVAYKATDYYAPSEERCDHPIEAIPASAFPTKATRPMNSALISDRLDAIATFKMRPWQEALAAYLVEKSYCS